ERTCLHLFHFSFRDQASNWRERLSVGSISTSDDLTICFLPQFFLPGRATKLQNDILMLQQHQGESLSKAWNHFKDLLQKVPHHGIDLWLQVQIFYDHVNTAIRRTIDQTADGKLHDKNAKESWALLEDLALYDNESWNDPRNFAKPVKEISLPQDVLSTSDCYLIELENQVQCLIESYLAPNQPVQVNKIASSNTWKLYTNGASSSNGSGAGLILVSLEEKEYTYALRFELESTNNEAKYEALGKYCIIRHIVWFVKYYASVGRFVADFLYVPPNGCSPRLNVMIQLEDVLSWLLVEGKHDATTVDINAMDLLRQAIRSSPGKHNGTASPESICGNSTGGCCEIKGE
nr:zinc finger, CCHC-type [Tanacetum cinerariifolium]